MAYNSNETGRFEIHVVGFRNTGTKPRASVDGGFQPRWRGDGRELFYLSADGAMMAVDVIAEADSLRFGPPRRLSDLHVVPSFRLGQYAVTADGQRFVVRRQRFARLGFSARSPHENCQHSADPPTAAIETPPDESHCTPFAAGAE